MAASVAQNSTVNIDQPKSSILGGLWGRVQKVSKNLSDLTSVISGEAIMKQAQQVRENISNISSEDIVSRVQSLGERLRNIKREDVISFGANVGIGLGAKALAVAIVGGSGGSALAVAALGGALVGVSKAAYKHARSGKSASEFINLEAFSRENLGKLLNRETYTRASINKFFKGDSVLKNTVSSMAISVATLGYSEIFEFATGDTLGHTLSKTFNKLSDGGLSKKLFALMPGSTAHAADLPNVPRPIQTIPATSAPMAAPASASVPTIETSNVPRPIATVPASAPVAAEPLNVPKPLPAAPVDQPVNVPKPIATAPATPSADTPVNVPKPIADISLGTNKNIDDNERARAMAWLKSMNSGATATPDTPVAAAPSTNIPRPIAVDHPTNTPKPIATAKPIPSSASAAASVSEKGTSLERARKWMASQGVQSDKVVRVKDLATANLSGVDPKHIVIETDSGVTVRMPAAPNVDAELKTVNAVLRADAVNHPTTPQADLDPQKMAAACVADLPKSQAAFDAQSGVLPNTCVTVDGKATMAAGDYVILRDAAETVPSAKRGLRALFASSVEKTSDFISRVVSAEALQQMSAEKLAVAPAP